MNPKQYRDYIYRLRAHPLDEETGFTDSRDSFIGVYGSLLPFLIAEYFVELNAHSVPAGLIFPTGFLLFWAFYYTYYKPGFLEERLTSPTKWDVMTIPGVLVGVCIWFVKVTFVELAALLFGAFVSKPRKQNAGAKPRPQARNTSAGQAQPRPKVVKMPHSATPQKPRLPADIIQALRILNLPETSDWQQIHHRYRELAKQYHPDLNRDITAVGRRFMMYDAAYRKLSAVKSQYFSEKRPQRG